MNLGGYALIFHESGQVSFANPFISVPTCCQNLGKIGPAVSEISRGCTGLPVVAGSASWKTVQRPDLPIVLAWREAKSTTGRRSGPARITYSGWLCNIVSNGGLDPNATEETICVRVPSGEKFIIGLTAIHDSTFNTIWFQKDTC